MGYTVHSSAVTSETFSCYHLYGHTLAISSNQKIELLQASPPSMVLACEYERQRWITSTLEI